MFIVMGATGHVGGAVTRALRAHGQTVLALAHDDDKAAILRNQGIETAIIDVQDSDALRRAFRQGRRAFLLNPPAPPTTDTDRQECKTAAAIIAALDGSSLEKVVLESTYGAQPGEAIGDLSVLYGLEQALAAQAIPFAVLRAAYYMTNWDQLLPQARQGQLPTMFAPTLRLPMVAPADLGTAAARLLMSDDTGIHHVEGPQRYTTQDVSDAFAKAIGHPVQLQFIPRQDWERSFRKMGFSAEAARAYTRMTQATVDGDFIPVVQAERGEVTLERYIAALAAD
jgi:uncharacterized protein YbjT (DUF2867 family)